MEPESVYDTYVYWNVVANLYTSGKYLTAVGNQLSGNKSSTGKYI